MDRRGGTNTLAFLQVKQKKDRLGSRQRSPRIKKEAAETEQICGKDGPHRKEGKRTTPVWGACAILVA
jgi:hypothetical protein